MHLYMKNFKLETKEIIHQKSIEEGSGSSTSSSGWQKATG